jgi:hypothetical protein
MDSSAVFAASPFCCSKVKVVSGGISRLAFEVVQFSRLLQLQLLPWHQELKRSAPQRLCLQLQYAFHKPLSTFYFSKVKHNFQIFSDRIQHNV